MQTFRGGGGMTPNTAPSTTQNSTCSTWLIVSFSHFQKLPDKNYFFVWQKNSGTSSGIAQNALNALNALNGLIWREKISPGNQKKSFRKVQNY